MMKKTFIFGIISILCLSSCSESTEEGTVYEELVSVSSIIDSKDPTKIMDFSSFFVNDSWKISEDGRAIFTHEKGVGKRLVNSSTTHEDKFDLSASIVAEGDSFEVVIGKWASLAGTMFGLKKDSSGGSFITTYLILSNNEQVLSNIIKLDNVSFYSGKKVHISISKRTESASYFHIVVSDEDGHTDIITGVGLSDSPNNYITNDGKGQFTGYAWGNVCAYMIEGETMQISDFTFGYPIERDLNLIVLGHSYIEGNSIAGQKDQRFAYLTCKDIGLDKTLILGQGGQTASSLSQLVKTYAKWFSNTKYAMINIGGNDFYNDPTKAKIQACINDCEEINQTLLSYGIKPIWIIDSGFLINNQNGIDEIESFSNWLIQQKLYVDVRKCFRDANGNNSPNAYLSDGKHPTVAVHHAIYEEIKSQAEYLFH